MKYVLDSSVALKWVLPETDSGTAIRLRDEYSLNRNEGHLKPSEVPLSLIKDSLERGIQHRLASLKSGRHLPFSHSIGEAGIEVGLAAQVLAYPRQNATGDPHIGGARVTSEKM
jgi:hypothetical protein